jgi:hypothetical protein
MIKSICFLLLFFFIIVILYYLFKKDEKIIGHGTYMNVYKSKKNIVIKKYKYLNMDLILKYLLYSIINPFKYDNINISNKISKDIFNSVKICKKYFNNCKFFAKIYKIDFKNKEYEQEYINNDFTIENCPDYKQQLRKLNKILIKTGYNLYDCKEDNFRVDNNGILKVIDPMLTRNNPLDFSSINQIYDSKFNILNSINLYDNSNIFIYEINS